MKIAGQNHKFLSKPFLFLSVLLLMVATVAEAERSRRIIITRGFYVINREVDMYGNLWDNGGMTNKTREIYFTRSGIKINYFRDWTYNFSNKRQVFRNYLVGMNVNGYEVTRSRNVVKKPKHHDPGTSHGMDSYRAIHRQLAIYNPNRIQE